MWLFIFRWTACHCLLARKAREHKTNESNIRTGYHPDPSASDLPPNHNQSDLTNFKLQNPERWNLSVAPTKSDTMENNDNLNEGPVVPHHRPHGHRHAPIVSGESDDGETDELYQLDPSDPAHGDGLYDANLDEEDESYVYKHMRSGVEENVTVVHNEKGVKKTKTISVLKPRHSDAQLQCPCCFQIVCMDCQRHERYLNQFRAMFVMGITVDWNSKLVYDELQQVLVSKPLDPEIDETADDKSKTVQGDDYFAVLCANCSTQVAVLDMKDEVYHFHGCLESL